MNILIIARSNLYTSPGGDTVQIDMTAKYLRKLGGIITIGFSNESFKYEDYDILHFFNIIRPDDILPHINHKVPFVVSTIFVDYSEYEKSNRGFIFKIFSTGQIEYIKSIARWIINGDKIKSNYFLFHGQKKSIKKIISKASMLLPNSKHEYLRLLKYTGDVKVPYRKIVNAIDDKIFNYKNSEITDFKDTIICVGRIEGRKNQLNLIKALKNTNLSVLIIGKPSPNHIKYYNKCRKEAQGFQNIRFIEHISHDKLVGIYNSAKVHVLPSWFETTGLSSLEAGAMGCNIVITKKGDTEEYFKDMAFYCEPDDVNSIKETVLKAYYEPINPKLREYILKNYIWEITAQKTLSVYNEILKKYNF